MMDDRTIEIRCVSCGKWFVPGADALDDGSVKDPNRESVQECPHCGAIGEVSKENMRLRACSVDAHVKS